METDTRLAHIPSELTERPQWVCWKRELRPGARTEYGR